MQENDKTQNSCMTLLRITTVVCLTSLLWTEFYCGKIWFLRKFVICNIVIINDGGLLYKRELIVLLGFSKSRVSDKLLYCNYKILGLWVVKACIDWDITINFMLDRFRSYKNLLSESSSIWFVIIIMLLFSFQKGGSESL